MFLTQALDQLQKFTPDDFSKLSGLLEPGLIEQCLEDTGVTTVRQLVLHLDLMLSGKRPYFAPSAVV